MTDHRRDRTDPPQPPERPAYLPGPGGVQIPPTAEAWAEYARAMNDYNHDQRERADRAALAAQQQHRQQAQDDRRRAAEEAGVQASVESARRDHELLASVRDASPFKAPVIKMSEQTPPSKGSFFPTRPSGVFRLAGKLNTWSPGHTGIVIAALIWFVLRELGGRAGIIDIIHALRGCQ